MNPYVKALLEQALKDAGRARVRPKRRERSKAQRTARKRQRGR